MINGSLQDLWNTPMEGYAMAAVTDRNLDMQRQRLNLEPDSPYFNAGVMLIDLKQWRKESILDRALNIANANANILNNHDQDLLNILFEKRVLLVHQRWNAMSHLWGLDPAWLKDQGGLNQEEQEAHDAPVVIHFAGGGFAKPWNYRCPHPWKERYRQLAIHTPWADVPLEDTPQPSRSNLVSRSLRKASRLITKLRG